MSERDQAFVEFVETANPSLRRTAYLISGDRHKADDIVQDALYKLYLSWPRIQRVGNPFAYARRMVVNAAYDGGRRPWRREVAIAELPDRPGSADFAAGHAARDEVLEALRTLGARQRACVVLRYYEDLSVEQTAEILGCSQGTVKSQAARGLETLRKAMNLRPSPAR
ncbi:SigE family RNA polymerase sigma factor [Kribbella sandramycini]|uniref:RNA polymerase sigma-70 factor (Sigma-E family) n=1 Tax=Kribbella sandramycini TaxID=60450 RepID=A0A7Y4L1J2_9ACTN|nr:SigE family RNA polymerase sigma factor [Kribbella sandramycini]MBB6564903.1 RNA polymerase sigma-70 factor (sigma-E family) [Kribbella sandramycini]NOL42599.1 SigE family RNA polymerase sigma factor [Kribbella sandramycini]